METILSLSRISKTFGGIRALDSAEFRLAGGEIHALIGANGAGKSTLIKILTGAHRPDAGEGVIELFGKSVAIENPAHARALGISAVYQEFSLINPLSVAENMYLGRLPKRNGFVVMFSQVRMYL